MYCKKTLLPLLALLSCFFQFEAYAQPCTPPTVIVSNSGPICSGATLTLSETGGDAVNWTWTSSSSTVGFSSSSTQSPIVIGAVNGDVFTVVAIDAAGCIDSASTTVFISTPTIDLVTATDPTCASNNGLITISASGGVGALAYSIDNGGTFSSSNIFPNLIGGSYDVLVQDLVGCLTIATAAVLVDDPGLTLSAVETSASCFAVCDGSVQINQVTGTAPYSYTWNFGAVGDQNGAATNLCHGTYSVDVQDGIGCTANLVFFIDQPEQMALTSFAMTETSCADGACDGTLDVLASGTDTYEFNGVVNGSGSFNSICPGSHTLILTNSVGCIVSESINFATQERPVANFGALPGEMSLPDHSTSLFNNSSNATNYSWTISGPDFQYTTTDSDFDLELPYQGGNYDVCLIAMNSTTCEDTLCDNIEVRDEFTLWVPNSFTPDGDEFNNTFKPIVSDVDAQSYDLFVFNRWGEVVFESHDPQTGWDGTYHGKLAETGIYVWKITLKSVFTDELRVYDGFVNMIY